MQTRKSRKTLGKASGMSLIELMISQALGLVVIAASIGLIAPAISGFATSSSVSRIQESARIALDELDHAVRLAGYRGCNSAANSTNVVDSKHTDIPATLSNWAYRDYSIRGFDANESNAINSVLGRTWQTRRPRTENVYIGDLILVRGTKGQELEVTSHDTYEQTISFRGDVTDQLHRGQIIELNDCIQTTTLQISQRLNPEYEHNTNTTVVQYGAEHTVNCSAVTAISSESTTDGGRVLLGGDGLASCINEDTRRHFSEYQFSSGTEAHLVTNILYYIGARDESGTSYLYRTGTANNGSRIHTEAVVEGVENLRLIYGIDLDANGTPDDYRSASDINRDPDTWSQIISIKIWMMLSIVTGHEQTSSEPPISFPDHSGELVSCEQGSPASAEICPHLKYGEEGKKFYTRRVIEKEIYIRNITL